MATQGNPESPRALLRTERNPNKRNERAEAGDNRRDLKGGLRYVHSPSTQTTKTTKVATAKKEGRPRKTNLRSPNRQSQATQASWIISARAVQSTIGDRKHELTSIRTTPKI